MTRRNNKRNNRRNRQSNNTPELPPFAQMLFGAIVDKGVDMIAKKIAEIAEQETPDIHAEGISNQDVTNINNGKATLSKLRIPSDGSAVEYLIPDNLHFFFDEEGKLMVRQKTEHETAPDDKEGKLMVRQKTEHETAPDDKEGNPITYDDILKKFYLDKTAYWACDEDDIREGKQGLVNYKDSVNCTTPSQAKRCNAFNKLQNIAKYLNGNWKPDFEGSSKKWCIFKDICYDVTLNYTTNQGIVYFKNEDLANEAIRLMGKDSLNDLFSTDW